ncbi:hypothetical protein CRE_29562 [Caenorhabditis remanei]|uniref:C-type lectin domain-containing protein n=1 Tax=Caenorhabditis remanei TaxID=31234 RepID=E3LVP1_CAERE|nr:hypothetical protein CRE_29562 [Caenorhabditis remanei]
MLMKILITFGLFVLTNPQVDRDWSFQSMCAFWNGDSSYRPRTNGLQSMEGDKCTFDFPVSTDTQESAKRYCEEHVPYHINEATSGFPTKCAAEATLVCQSGWIQLFGRCYKMTKELKTKQDAVVHCKAQKDDATIAFIHRETLPFRINDYFTRVSRIWVDASEAITKDLIDNNLNGNLILALDGFEYNLPNIALTRVDSSETAMVLCEYTPSITIAESHYLLRRYGEIYYPTIFTSEKAYVRSTSSIQRNNENRMADNDYCSKLLKPFLGNVKAQSAVPTEEMLRGITVKRDATIIRTSVYSGDAKRDSRISSDCTPSKARNYGIDYAGNNGNPFFKSLKDDPIWRSGEPKETCDGGSWSTGISLSRDHDKKLEAMSDARYAPIYCQTNFETMGYGDCPDGFQTFYRKEIGQKWCHIFVSKKNTFDGAELECQKMGGHVSGFTNQEELDLMDKMWGDSGADPNETAWIGAKRREECITMGIASKIGGFHPDDNNPCSRLSIRMDQRGCSESS